MAKKNNNGGGNDTIRVSSIDQSVAKKKLQNKFNGKIPNNAVLTYDKTTGKYTYTVLPTPPKVDQKRQGGYPKSDSKNFMKSMGYYQAGGLGATPMYGSNTIPGTPETAAITYTEADPSKLKALDKELKEAQESTKFQDEAEAAVQKQASAISGIEQGLSQGIKGADKLGVFDKIKQAGAAKELAAKKAAEEAAKALAAKQASKVVATQTTQKAIEQAAPGAFQKVAPKVVTGVQTAGMKAAQEGTAQLAQATTSTAAGAGAGIGMGGVGAIASLAGEGIKMASDDQDATTMNVGETVGSGLSGIGTGIGAAMTTAALMGSTLGPVGTAAGVVGGAIYGLGKGLIQRGKARKEEAKAERKKEKELSKIGAKKRVEEMKSKQYSGFDFGSDIAKYGGYYQMGGVQLPGGTMNPIPGSDAVEFKGQSHDQGGIMVDPMTEVEGGETMDQVTIAKKGGKRDYFFSQHLKMGGKSFAQRHKEILKNGGSQRDVDALAKLQEKKAGRDPNAVKLGAGGYKMYDKGGEFEDFTRTTYNTVDSPVSYDDETDMFMTDRARQQRDFHFNMLNKGFLWDAEKGVYYKPELQEEEEEKSTTTTTANDKKNEERQTIEYIEPKTIDKIELPRADLELAVLPDDLKDDDSQKKKDRVLPRGEYVKDQLKKGLKNSDLLTTSAQIGQLIPAAAAFATKPKYMSEPGKVNNIRAERLDRVSYNTERAQNAADARAMNRFIETSGIGPAGIIAKMAAYGRKQAGDLKIAAAESRVNTEIGNQEAQIAMQAKMANQQARLNNIKNAMYTDEFNRSADAAVEDRKLMALDNAFKSMATMNTDRLKYDAQERLAQAISGQTGVYTREQIGKMVQDSLGLEPGSADYTKTVQDYYMQMLKNQQEQQNAMYGGVKKYI
tara:strand:- start:23471 stop:26164 length:2694 start_codon:yes stop_codon:yes gene_type:complete